MAESYTRLIEFKVKDGAIKAATERLFKSLDRIEKKLDQIGGKGGKGFTQVGKGADKAAASLKKLQATSTGVGKASGYLRASIVGLGAGLVASNAAVTALDQALRKTSVPFNLLGQAADGTTGKLLAHKAAFLASTAAVPVLAKALMVGAGAYAIFGSKIFNVKKQLTGFVDGVQKARKTVRDFVKGIKAPSGGGSELTIFDRIQSAKGGGLVGLRKLLDQVTAAQSKLISTNLGYVSSSEKVRAVEKALNTELMARKRIMDQIITNERARTPTSTLTAAAGAAGGLEGLRQLLSEAQGIQDRMLTTNENYKVASARVRNIQKAINAELEKRDKIMGKVNAKEEKSVTLGKRLRGIAGNLGGKAVQAARPGRGIEGRGLLTGGLAGVAGYGMSANAAAETLAGKITGGVSSAVNWGAENVISNIPGLHGVGAGVSKTIADMTTLNTVARSVGQTMADHPVIIGSALAAWVVFGNEGIWKAVKGLFGARDAAENATKSIKKTTAGWFKLAQKTDVFGVSTKTANKLIGITNGLFKSQKQQLTLNTKAIKVLGHTAEETTKKLAAMGKNKGSVLRNISRSRTARSGSGFADFSRVAGEYNPYQLQQSRGAGFGRGAGRDFSERFDFGITPSYSTGKIGPSHPIREISTAMKSLERKNKQLVKQGKERLKGERLITKEVQNQIKAKARLATKEKESIDRQVQRMFTPQKRKERRGGARVRMMGGKMGMKNLTSQGLENLMLGAGFPLLFGGGVGSVAGGLGGSALGNAMGMGGFGTQIIGSAIGAQLDSLVMKANELGIAVKELDMTKLKESGIKINKELSVQIAHLKEIGDLVAARSKIELEIFKNTGAMPGVHEGITNVVKDLGNAWNRISTTIGTTLGVLTAPFMVALKDILNFVNGIFVVINAVMSPIAAIERTLGELIFGSQQYSLNMWEASEAGKQARIEAERKLRIVKEEMALSGKLRGLDLSRPLTDTFDDKMTNIELDYKTAELQADFDRDKDIKNVYKDKDAGGLELQGKAAELEVEAINLKYNDALNKAYATKLKAIAALEREEQKTMQIGKMNVKHRMEDLLLQRQINEAKKKKDIGTMDELKARQKILDVTFGLHDKLQEDLTLEQEFLEVSKAIIEIKEIELDLSEKIAASDADINKKITDIERERRLLESQLGLKKEMIEQTRQMNEYEVGQLEYDLKILEIREETNNVLKDETNLRMRSALLLLQAVKLEEIALKKTGELTDAERELKAVFDSMGVSIKNGLVDGITAAIQGTKTLGEVASNVLRQISTQLINFGVGQILGGIPGLDKIFKAKGGPVKGGSPYIVGEEGPELFVPGSSGKIIPNHYLNTGDSGGEVVSNHETNIVVNVDASGSSVEGAEEESRELGTMLAVAIQSELVRQKRPGGLLAG